MIRYYCDRCGEEQKPLTLLVFHPIAGKYDERQVTYELCEFCVSLVRDTLRKPL